MRLGGRRFFLNLTIIAASVCLALGITLPILKLTQFAFWETEHSLISTVRVLLGDGQMFLGGIVLVFSILLPVTEGSPTRSNLRTFALSFLIILATVFFALGIIMPTIRFTTVYVWTNEHSILTIIYALFENDEIFLCAVVFAVSVFFPFLKLFYLLTLITSHDMSADFRKKSIATMEWLGRYSMTDVMVLALMIFYVNSSGYTEARVLPGVYFFAASALMTMVAYGWANVSTPTERASAAITKGRVTMIAAKNRTADLI